MDESENYSDDDEFLQDLLPKIVSRGEWGAKESRSKRKFHGPVKRLVLTTTRTSRCYTKAHCMHNLRKYQQDSFKDKHDIPYNFLIGRDGRVYEGMGWEYQADSTYSGWFSLNRFFGDLYETSIYIAFIQHKDIKPSMKQVKVALGLLVAGIQNDKVLETVDIMELDVKGPIFPEEEMRILKGENTDINDEQYKKEQYMKNILRAVNEDVKIEKQITMEQLEEDLKDEDGIIKKFNELEKELKKESERLIRENYPWLNKSK